MEPRDTCMACIVTFHESWEMEEVVKQANGVVKQHGIRTSMIGKVTNCTDTKRFVEDLDQEWFRQDVMCTLNVYGESSIRVSQTLSCSPHLAYVHRKRDWPFC